MPNDHVYRCFNGHEVKLNEGPYARRARHCAPLRCRECKGLMLYRGRLEQPYSRPVNPSPLAAIFDQIDENGNPL